MQKRRGFVVNVALGQIFIILVSVVALGFIVGESHRASAQRNSALDSFTNRYEELESFGAPSPPSATPVPNGASGGGGANLNVGENVRRAMFDANAFGNEFRKNVNNLEIDQKIKDSLLNTGTETINDLGQQTRNLEAFNELKKTFENDPNFKALPPEKQQEFLGKLGESFGGDGVIATAPYSGSLFGLIPVKGFFLGHLADGLTWSIAVAGAIQLVGGIAGLDPGTTNALSISVAAGIMSGQAAYGLFGKGTLTAGNQGILAQVLSPTATVGIGLGVAAVTFVLLYKKKSQKVVEFQCLPWEAPLGGSNCEECNSGDLPCSEYRCKSLGQACELVNPGTDEEKCVWVSRSDVTSPTITPWVGALSTNHQYTNHDTRPPSLGTKIVRTDSSNGCIAAFTALQFGLATNEPSQCKIDTDSQVRFDDMRFFFGENNLFRQNHSQSMRLPSPQALAEVAEGDLIIGADGKYDFFVRCRDANGNVNEDAFVFSFCVDSSPDTTPPVIGDTSIISGSPVAFGSQEVNVVAFVNEPAECKWSIQDKAYADMENIMTCSSEVYEQNARQLYECKTTLTGIKDRTENKFFFRCKDQPGKEENNRNVNTQSYEFSLLGSQSLNIISVGPEEGEKIFDSTDIVRVDLELETSNGAEEGKAICYFSPDGDEGSFVAMFETNNFRHKQTLQLSSGSYNYYFRCIDLGGNADSTNVTFSVETDNVAPLITRIYKEGVESLKMITSEKAMCSYSLNDCNFEISSGVQMRILDVDKKTVHFSQWQSGKTYHIKCQDEFGNQPGTNQCSLVVSASTFV